MLGPWTGCFRLAVIISEDRRRTRRRRRMRKWGTWSTGGSWGVRKERRSNGALEGRRKLNVSIYIMQVLAGVLWLTGVVTNLSSRVECCTKI